MKLNFCGERDGGGEVLQPNAALILGRHLDLLFGFINGVDNVNWPLYRDSKS